MPDLLDESFRFIGVLWAKGNYLARAVIAIVLIWPLVLLGVALILPPQTAISVVPIITIGCLLLILLGPSKLAIVELGFYRYIARIVVPFLLIGLYSAFVPLGNAQRLVPIIALIWYLILFLFWGGRQRWGTVSAIILIAFSLAYIPGTLQRIRNLSHTGDAPSVGASVFLSQPSDQTIVTNVYAAFWRDSALKLTAIRVSSQNGVVVLTGIVSLPFQRTMADRIARAQEGVRVLIDRLRVRP